MPSVLWHCWLGGRKGNRPVKNWVWCAGVVICLERCADLHIWPSWCHCHSLSLASVKSRLVLPFWYRLTWVVPDKRPLNGCVHTHTHNHLTALCLGLPGWAGTRRNLLPTHTNKEEEEFAQTTRSTAWKLIPLRCLESARVVGPNEVKHNKKYITHTHTHTPV